MEFDTSGQDVRESPLRGLRLVFCSPQQMLDVNPNLEDFAQQRSLASGGYVGVRRVVRLLENGDGIKRVVDGMVDVCSQLINLRVAIMKYR